MHFSTGRNTVRGGLEETADGDIQRNTGEEESQEELNKERTDKRQNLIGEKRQEDNKGREK
jgi:hypothetical protein